MLLLVCVAVSGSVHALEPITYSVRDALSAGNGEPAESAPGVDCEGLAGQIDHMQDEPLRRAMAEERYQEECEGLSPNPIDQGPDSLGEGPDQ
jgi:hypothetical protein